MSTKNEKEVSQSEQIWNEIKGKMVHMFALPPQPVENCCRRADIEPSRCFLTYNASAFIPALETAIGDAYAIETAEKYIIVSRAKKF
jgi:hypothetical protein